MKRLKLSLIATTLAVSTLSLSAPAWQEGYTYQGGETVESQNAQYQCKGFPYNGWCGLGAYEPGVGFAWADAWTLVSSTVTSTPVVTPTPTGLCNGVDVPDTRYETKTLSGELFQPYLELSAPDLFDAHANPSAGVTITYPDGRSEVIGGGAGTLRLTTDMDDAKLKYSYIYPGTMCPITVAVITLDITQVPTPGTLPEFVPGATDPATGDVYGYQGQCWEAKNNPGSWETPREGWFWTQVSCNVTPVVSCPPLAIPTPFDVNRNELVTAGGKRIKIADLLPIGSVSDLASLQVSGNAYLDGDELVLRPTPGTVTLAQRYKFDECRGGEYSDSYFTQRVFISVSVEVGVTITPTPTSCVMPTMVPPLQRTITINPAQGEVSFEQLFDAAIYEASSVYLSGGGVVTNTGVLFDGTMNPVQVRYSSTINTCDGLMTYTSRITSVELVTDVAERTPVIAYQPSWAFDLNAIQWDKLTHINYSFALPDADGSLTIEQPQNLQALSNAAVGKDTEIWLAIGGWTIGDGGGNDADWSTITSNPQLLERFKGEIQAAIGTYNLDGIDIDWEWPNNNTEKALYLQLMQELDAMLEPQGKGLSTAVVSRGANGQYVDAQVFELVDYFNLMAYDDNWPWSGDNKHSDMGVAQASLDYWINQRGVPADKVILGVPFYCRGNNQAISYEQLLANGADPDADAHQGCYYNGRVTMKAKAELAKQRAAGVMFWELSQDVEDHRSLLTVIDSVLNP